VMRYGDEGFNLDPPNIDLELGEVAGYKHSPGVRSAAHDRHLGKAVILWVDGHCSPQTLESLGYNVAGDGTVGIDGDNRLWSLDRSKGPWLLDPAEP